MNRLRFIKKKQSGRDVTGQVSVRHQGGEQKKYIRVIDFKRDKRNIEAKVVAIEYDPNRSTEIALVKFTDGDTRYILRPEGLKLNAVVVSGEDVDLRVGNTMPLSAMPIGTVVHNVELVPGQGGQIARGSGTGATIAAKEGDFRGLVACPRFSVDNIAEKNYLKCMEHFKWGDAIGVIHADNPPRLDFESGLFPCFALSGFGRSIADICPASGHCPSIVNSFTNKQ